MKNDLLVSVCMITYNQEKFIAEAIEGVLMQQTNFPIELVIGEDCSTDHTRDICLEYKAKYPDMIKLLLPENNLGMMRNFITTFEACTGKYIALCEGDDYWTDPYKLQKQVDFLEANKDFSICFHPVKIKNEKENKIVDDYITRDVQEVTDIYELAEGNYIHTPSVVFRKNAEVETKIASLYNFRVGDYPLHMLNAQYGKIKKIPDIMAIYRAGVGVWTSNDTPYCLSAGIDMVDKLIRLLSTDDEKIISKLKKQYGGALFTLYDIYQSKRDSKKAQDLFTYACINYPEIIYDEFEKRSSKLHRITNSMIYQLGLPVLKPIYYLINSSKSKNK